MSCRRQAAVHGKKRCTTQDPGRVFIFRGPQRSEQDGHYRCPTCTRPHQAHDADNGVPACQKPPFSHFFHHLPRKRSNIRLVHSSPRPSVRLSLTRRRSPGRRLGCDSVEPPDAAQTASSWQHQRVVECVCVRGRGADGGGVCVLQRG